jgi:hypothetical protein
MNMETSTIESVTELRAGVMGVVCQVVLGL